MNLRRAAWAAAALGIVGSQAGHLLAYELRFGAAAQHIQSTGVHSYFPSLVKTALGVASLSALAALFFVALARLATGRRIDREAAPPFVRLLATLFTLQLAIFATQETAEAMLGGSHPGAALQILLWGTIGQLPVALVAAVAIRWLFSRLGPALAQLDWQLDSLQQPVVYALDETTRPRFALVPVAASDFHVAAYRRRGPPSS